MVRRSRKSSTKKRRKIPNKDTKAYGLRELRLLRSKLLGLWRRVVKKMYGEYCVICGAGPKGVHIHHIENFLTCKVLRYDPRNGAPFCSGHHKYFKDSAHKSFVMMYLYMVGNRKEDIDYLINQCTKEPEEPTKEWLLSKIEEFENILREEK